MAEEIRLIVRGDDLGMTQGSLVAFERAYRDGVLTCASLLVPAPWFEGATGVLKANPGLCAGVHLSLVGEWQGYRWRPVQPWDKVPSLVDESGFLFGHPAELLARKPKLDEIEAEWRAQITLARQRVRIDYLDVHYLGLREYPGLEDLILRMAKELRLPISGWMGEKRIPDVTPIPEKKEKGRSPATRTFIGPLVVGQPSRDRLAGAKCADPYQRGRYFHRGRGRKTPRRRDERFNESGDQGHHQNERHTPHELPRSCIAISHLIGGPEGSVPQPTSHGGSRNVIRSPQHRTAPLENVEPSEGPAALSGVH